MAFFKHFPKTFYDFLNSGEKYQIDNIFQHVIVESDIFDNPNLYQKYRIRDGERPDVASYNLYGTTEYYWTFFLVNDILRKGGINSWPLGDIEFRAYIEKKYPSNFISAFVDPRSLITKGGIWPGTSQRTLKNNSDILLVKLGLGQELIPSRRTPDRLITLEINPDTTTESVSFGKFINSDVNTRVVTFSVEKNRILDVLNFSDPDDKNVYVLRKNLGDIAPRELVILQMFGGSLFFRYKDAPRYFKDSDGTIIQNIEDILEKQENDPDDYNLQGADDFPVRTEKKSDIKIVTNFEHEFTENQNNSEINVISPTLITRFASEFKRIINNE